MNEQKRILRDQARKHRARVNIRGDDAESAVSHFFESIAPPAGLSIAAYWPMGREFDTLPLLARALELGHPCALPVIRPDSKILKFARWNDEVELTPGPYGIMQPSIDAGAEWIEPEILIVPLLAFDRKGYRLGQGGGYYDATISALRDGRGVLAVGLAYAEQAVLFNLPTEEHDEPMDWIVTEQGAERYR